MLNEMYGRKDNEAKSNSTPLRPFIRSREISTIEIQFSLKDFVFLKDVDSLGALILNQSFMNLDYLVENKLYQRIQLCIYLRRQLNLFPAHISKSDLRECSSLQ